MNYSDLITLILTQLRTHVNSDQFLEQFRRSKAFVRHRKLTLKQVVAYLIYSKKRSMDIELSALQRQIPDIEFPDVSRQAVSKARRGILPDLFKELFDEQVETVYRVVTKATKYNLTAAETIIGSLFKCPSNIVKIIPRTYITLPNFTICFIENFLSSKSMKISAKTSPFRYHNAHE